MYDEQAERAGVIFGWILYGSMEWQTMSVYSSPCRVSPQNGNALCYIFLEPEFTYSCDVKRHHTVSKLAEAEKNFTKLLQGSAFG